MSHEATDERDARKRRYRRRVAPSLLCYAFVSACCCQENRGQTPISPRHLSGVREKRGLTPILQRLRASVRPSPIGSSARSMRASSCSARLSCLQRQRVGVAGLGRLRHASAPQHVVDRDQAAGAQQLQAALVVVRVARLVGVDEREVVAPGLAGGEPRVERGQRRPEHAVRSCAATPARSQYGRPTRVYSSLMSHARMRPSSGSASATASAL